MAIAKFTDDNCDAIAAFNRGVKNLRAISGIVSSCLKISVCQMPSELPSMQEILTSPAIPTMPKDSEAQELVHVLRGILQMQTQADYLPSTQDSDPFVDPSNSLLKGPGLFPRLATPQDEVEEYVNELVPALQLVCNNDKLDLGQRQEAIKFAADAVLARKATGMVWSQALSTTLANSTSNDPSERAIEHSNAWNFEARDADSSCCKAISDRSLAILDGKSEVPADPVSGREVGASPAMQSLEEESSPEADKENSGSDSSMVDSTSELMDDEDGVYTSAREMIGGRDHPLPIFDECIPPGTVMGRPYQGIMQLPGYMSIPTADQASMACRPDHSTPLLSNPFAGGAACILPSNGSTNMRELVYRVAALQPINLNMENIKKPKRRNVRISKDPQSIAARRRRERISHRIRILQRLVPGGTKMDTASMLEEAIHYMKFLKMQVQAMERLENWFSTMNHQFHHPAVKWACLKSMQFVEQW